MKQQTDDLIPTLSGELTKQNTASALTKAEVEQLQESFNALVNHACELERELVLKDATIAGLQDMVRAANRTTTTK